MDKEKAIRQSFKMNKKNNKLIFNNKKIFKLTKKNG